MNSKRYILLVEDSQHDELLTLRALKPNGINHGVIVCRDGEEALDWLHARGKFQGRDTFIKPTVVLLDLKIPKADGLEVLQEIRRLPHSKFLPVVILTTSKEERDVARSYESGANSFVQKPIDFKAFSEVIKNLGTYWLLINESPAGLLGRQALT